MLRSPIRARSSKNVRRSLSMLMRLPPPSPRMVTYRPVYSTFTMASSTSLLLRRMLVSVSVISLRSRPSSFSFPSTGKSISPFSSTKYPLWPLLKPKLLMLLPLYMLNCCDNFSLRDLTYILTRSPGRTLNGVEFLIIAGADVPG